MLFDYNDTLICLSVCMSVRYALRPCRRQYNQNLHEIPFGPGEGQDGVGATKGGEDSLKYLIN
jgi:hypothetical protein